MWGGSWLWALGEVRGHIFPYVQISFLISSGSPWSCARSFVDKSPRKQRRCVGTLQRAEPVQVTCASWHILLPMTCPIPSPTVHTWLILPTPLTYQSRCSLSSAPLPSPLVAATPNLLAMLAPTMILHCLDACFGTGHVDKMGPTEKYLTNHYKYAPCPRSIKSTGKCIELCVV